MTRVVWNAEKAKAVETLLAAIIEQAPGVFKVVGCSNDSAGDYKITFCSHSSKSPHEGFFLEWMEAKNELVAWAGGLGYRFPEEVNTHIRKLFPGAFYYQTKSVGIDGFHHWQYITYEELEQATKE